MEERRKAEKEIGVCSGQQLLFNQIREIRSDLSRNNSVLLCDVVLYGQVAQRRAGREGRSSSGRRRGSVLLVILNQLIKLLCLALNKQSVGCAVEEVEWKGDYGMERLTNGEGDGLDWIGLDWIGCVHVRGEGLASCLSHTDTDTYSRSGSM